MKPSRFTPAEWDALFDRHLVSGLTQRRFCEVNEVPFDAFRSRYQKSAKFAGKRRRSPGKSSSEHGGFVAVRPRPSSVSETPAANAAVTIRLGTAVAIECPLGVGVETIARLAREINR